MRDRPQYYVLDGHRPVPATLADWAALVEDDAARRVAETWAGRARVSTVFLGLDHRWGDGPPLLFESMVSGGAHDGAMARYTTWDEAEAGHRAPVELAAGGAPAEG